VIPTSRTCTACGVEKPLCDFPLHPRGFCGRRSHCKACCSVARHARYRLAHPVPRGRRSLADRFWEKVDRRGPDECWIWTAAKEKGYGIIGRGGREGNLLAHRVAYELLVGPIPEGLTLDHFRMNPGPRNAPCSKACGNPAHLEPVTMVENVMRSGSIPAQNARKVVCLRGHDAWSHDTRGGGKGGRRCRTCDATHHRNNYRPAALQEACK
jgi:hypothetical protein